MSDDRSYPFPTFSGLLTSWHRKRMGAAIWEFLWCIDRTTKEYTTEDGELRGVVLGGKPIKADEVAQELGGHPDTVKSNLRKLVLEGYLDIKRTPYGQIIEVRKSKKFKKRNGENALSRQGENTLSGERNGENSTSVRKNTLSGSGENAASNKTLQLDITEDINKQHQQNVPDVPIDQIQNQGEGGVPSPGPKEPGRNTFPDIFQSDAFIQVRDHFHKQTGIPELTPLDLSELETLLSDGISVETICKGIDVVIQNHKPKHQLDKIRSLRYCSGKIRDLHYASQKKSQIADDPSNRQAQVQKNSSSSGSGSDYINRIRKAGL